MSTRYVFVERRVQPFAYEHCLSLDRGLLVLVEPHNYGDYEVLTGRGRGIDN